MTSTYNRVGYVIGRFQPLHKGHEYLIREALKKVDRLVILLGDTGCRPNYKNPWTVAERRQMIELALWEHKDRIQIFSVEDIPYDNAAWVESVHQVVGMDLQSEVFDECILFGHKKDATSFYLDLFPSWKFVEVPRLGDFDATLIRKMFFHGRVRTSLIDPIVQELIWQEQRFPQYDWIKLEAVAAEIDRQMWNCDATRCYGGPILLAVDALVETPTRVLLIRRGGNKGKGAIALPGGFLNPDERLVPAALRELKEEVGIDLSGIYIGNQLGSAIPFDHPQRSTGARIVTNVFHSYMPESFAESNTPVAGDDADEAMWVLKSDLPVLKRQFFSDHYHIVQYFINKGTWNS